MADRKLAIGAMPVELADDQIEMSAAIEVVFIGTALSAHSPRVAHVYEVKALS
jgi:hypothetical protein